jgi:hypothetical protein
VMLSTDTLDRAEIIHATKHDDFVGIGLR